MLRGLLGFLYFLVRCIGRLFHASRTSARGVEWGSSKFDDVEEKGCCINERCPRGREVLELCSKKVGLLNLIPRD